MVSDYHSNEGRVKRNVEFFEGSNEAVGPSEKLQTNQVIAGAIDDSIRQNGNCMKSC